MKGFKKLALTAAIAALPAAGFAMEPMQDEELGDVTGQDGISIGLSLNQTMDVLVVDTDGLDTGSGPAAYTAAGGIFISGMSIDNGAGGATSADINIDAGGNGTDGVLVVEVALGAGFTIGTGSLSAVDATGVTDIAGAAAVTAGTEILSNMDITFGSGLDLELQLGDGAATFLEFTAANIGTLTLTGFSLSDGGQSISTDITINNLDMSGTTASITATGLQLTLGASMNNLNVGMDALTIGGGTIGDVYILGLNMAGDTITIGGK